MSIDSQLPQEPTKSESPPPVESQETESTPEPEVPVKEPEPLDAQEAALAEMGELKFYKRGDIVEGTVVQVTSDSLIVDIGTKTEGIIGRDEIGITGQSDLSGFAVGDAVSAVVVREDEEGTYHLSKRRADQRLVWEKVEESAKDGSRMEAIVWKAIKGGLLVDIGAIAFITQSLVDIRRVDDLESLVGEKFDVRVLEYDREAKPHPKVVVSRRACLEEDITRERDGVYDTLEAGAVIEGKVVKLTNYGAFVDIGGIQGLLHVSEMSLTRINRPSEVMKEGDVIKVKILKVDKKKKRISLGRRELLPNPWETVNKKFKPGTVVEGVVVRTADFGAFIRLDNYFEGLAHISELVDNKISHAREVFNQGDKVNVYIMNIDKKSRRIKLSVRRAADAERRREVEGFMKSQGDLENVFAARLQEALADIDLPSEEEEKPPMDEAAVEPPKDEAAVEPPKDEAAVEPTEEKPAEDIAEPVKAEETALEEAPAETESEEPAEEESAETIAEPPEAEEPSAEAAGEQPEKSEETPEETKETEESPEESESSSNPLESEMDGTPI